jgi:5-methylcytosine-specific restriction endonuclease McrA
VNAQHPLRQPCKNCGGNYGTIKTAGGQDVVRCAICEAYQYNAPKVETGRAVRSVSTTHENIKPGQRSRILLRATGHCELCGKGPSDEHPLTVGHLLSVREGMEMGMKEFELNNDENLAAMCSECNLGIGSETVPLRLCFAIIRARAKNRTEKRSAGQKEAS